MNFEKEERRLTGQRYVTTVRSALTSLDTLSKKMSGFKYDFERLSDKISPMRMNKLKRFNSKDKEFSDDLQLDMKEIMKNIDSTEDAVQNALQVASRSAIYTIDEGKIRWEALNKMKDNSKLMQDGVNLILTDWKTGDTDAARTGRVSGYIMTVNHIIRYFIENLQDLLHDIEKKYNMKGGRRKRTRRARSHRKRTHRRRTHRK